MQAIRSIKSLRRAVNQAKSKGKTVGFVPTMGALHQGHLSLVRRSKKENTLTVMSIFVNPTQFGPKEDFAKYPRNLRRDKLFAKKEKVDILFLPSAVDIYPKGYTTGVEVGKMADGLCGRFRPGHFKGVATVVAKLLNIVSPDVMYLGQKDAQQAVILQRMVKDLNFPLHIKVLPTVREKSGLALSSRNTYLNPDERKRAAVIFQSLRRARALIQKGERRATTLTAMMRAMISRQRPAKIDYIECRDANTLDSVSRLKGKVLIALAVWFGKTRLIDNTVVSVR